MKAQAIFHNGKGRGSRIITRFFRGKWSHESTRYTDIPFALIAWANKTYGPKWERLGIGFITGSDWEFESIQGKGVHHQKFVPSENQCWKDFEHTEEQAVEMFKHHCDFVGRKYDWSGILGFLTRRRSENPLKWFCSELGCHVRRLVGIVTQNREDALIPPDWSAASVIFTTAPNSPIQD